MTPFVLIPVKPPAQGKSRLRDALPDAARVELVWLLFDHVLGVTIRRIGAARSIVISREPDVLEYAAARNLQTLPEQEDCGLNGALLLGRSEAIRRGADAILVLPSDLPCLTDDDIDALIAAAQPPCVVIAPDERDQGTNALLLSPSHILPFTFGENSFAAHVAAARQCGIEPTIVRRAGLAFDVDTAEDYARLRRGECRRAII